MGVSTVLADGETVIAYQTSSGVWFETLDADLDPVGAPVQAAAGSSDWIGLKAQGPDGFTLGWDVGGQLYTASYAGGVQTAAPAPAGAWTGAPNPLAFTSDETAPGAILPDGGSLVSTTVPGGFTLQRMAADGAPVGPAFSQVQAHLGLYTLRYETPLAGGGYAIAYTYEGALLPFALIETAAFNADGTLAGTPGLAVSPPANGYTLDALSGLADGGYAMAWTSSSGPSGAELFVGEFSAAGVAVGTPVDLGAAGSGPVRIEGLPDGRYVVSWGADQHAVLTDPGAPLGATEPAPPSAMPTAGAAQDGALVAVGDAIALTGAAGWTSAVVLADHTLAVGGAADAGYGGHTAFAQTYDGSGQMVSALPAMGYAGGGQVLTTELTALDGGFLEVAYAGSGDYEIYGASGLVFAHNAYTSATAAFTGLVGGGYVTTDADASVLAVFGADGQVRSWTGLPLDGGAAPLAVEALKGGGFALAYADGHAGFYGADGVLAGSADFGASASGFATGLAATADGGLIEVQLSTDGGVNGFATALDVQTFGPTGAASSVLTLTQDLDPWHTQIAVQAHADDSAAVLWSQGGAVWGAEVAGGAAGPVHAAGVAASLSDLKLVELPADKAGLVWLQGGDIWAELFDPASGAIQRADLGAGDQDLSTVHALATASGGLAVSWHEGGQVLSAVLGADGRASAAASLPGDLVGVDAQGHGLVLADNAGSPLLYHYQLQDGLFWAA